ncbi:MAG: AraC family transcriptional regulator, partial [Bacteroidota bacterium]
KGFIRGFEFKDGLEILLFNCRFKKDVLLKVAPNSKPALGLHFCIEGSMVHLFNDQLTQYQLNPLLGTISAAPYNKIQYFKFPAQQKLLLTKMLIDRVAYRQKVDCEIDRMPTRLATLFTSDDFSQAFLYQSNYSISISECIQNICSNDYEGLVRATYMESKTLELLSLQIKQFKDDLNPIGRQTLMRKYDMEKLMEARDILVSNLAEAPTIPELAKQIGINQQKLKKGFKSVFNKTIFNFLSDERMNAARLMLVEGSLNIREIATRVGYSNKSHFSRRFKEKYGILPKDYLRSVRDKYDFD